MTRKCKGFTLIEVIIVMVITAIIVVPIGGLLNAVSYNFWSKHHNYQISTDVDAVIGRIAAYLKSVQAKDDLMVTGPHAIKIRTYDGMPVEFALDGKGRLEMTVGEEAREIVLRGVKYFDLYYYDKDGLEAVVPSQAKMIRVVIGVRIGDSDPNKESSASAILSRQRLINLWMPK